MHNLYFNRGIIVVGGLMAIALTFLPLTANADQDRRRDEFLFLDAIEDLDLTSQQRNQIGLLQLEARSRIEDILTPEQRDIVSAAVEEGAAFPEVMRAVNLTSSQRSELRSIMQETRQEMSRQFTPEQRLQLQEHMRYQSGRYQGRFTF